MDKDMQVEELEKLLAVLELRNFSSEAMIKSYDPCVFLALFQERISNQSLAEIIREVIRSRMEKISAQGSTPSKEILDRQRENAKNESRLTRLEESLHVPEIDVLNEILLYKFNDSYRLPFRSFVSIFDDSGDELVMENLIFYTILRIVEDFFFKGEKIKGSKSDAYKGYEPYVNGVHLFNLINDKNIFLNLLGQKESLTYLVNINQNLIRLPHFSKINLADPENAFIFDPTEKTDKINLEAFLRRIIIIVACWDERLLHNISAHLFSLLNQLQIFETDDPNQFGRKITSIKKLFRIENMVL